MKEFPKMVFSNEKLEGFKAKTYCKASGESLWFAIAGNDAEHESLLNIGWRSELVREVKPMKVAAKKKTTRKKTAKKKAD